MSNLLFPVPLTSLLVPMDQNVFPKKTFAVVTKTVVPTDHTTFPPSVTTALLTISSGVKCQVLIFVGTLSSNVTAKNIVPVLLMSLFQSVPSVLLTRPSSPVDSVVIGCV